MSITWLDPLDPRAPFPPVDSALEAPDGLLAAGGDLSPERLLKAYRHGVFPWYEVGQPILWWSPEPRVVLYPERLRITRSLRKTLRHKPWTVGFDGAFRDTIAGCAMARADSEGTWITREMLTAYRRLHAQGHAHSVEVYSADHELIGGLYGVAIGRVFFGESMFSRRSDASKVALVYLAAHLQAWGYPVIDCQLPSAHIARLGAEAISRARFIRLLEKWCPAAGQPAPWALDPAVEVTEWQPSAGAAEAEKR